MFEMASGPSLSTTLMRITPVKARYAAPHDAAERRGTNTLIVWIVKPALVAVCTLQWISLEATY